MKKLLSFLVMLGLGVGAWFYFKPLQQQDSSEALPEFKVVKGDLRINVLDGGNIKALDSLYIKNPIRSSNGAKIIKLVEEGYRVTEDDVKNGKVLVELDSTSIENDIVKHDVEFQQVESDFAQAKQDIKITESEVQSNLKSGRQKLLFALLDFQKYVGKEASKQILTSLDLPHDNQTLVDYEKQATAAIAASLDSKSLHSQAKDNQTENQQILSFNEKDSLAQGVDFSSYLRDKKLSEGEAEQQINKLRDEALVASSELSVVEQSVEGAKRLREKEFISRRDLDNEMVNLDKAKLSLKTKETELDLFIDYEFPKEAQKMLSNYEEALSDLIRSNRAGIAKMSKAHAKYNSSQRRYQLEIAKREEYKKQLALCTIKAEKAGLVAYGDPSLGYYSSRHLESIAEGATLKSGQVIITIPNMSKIGVDVNISESHIKKIAKGQRVIITAESVPDRQLEGQVTKVALLPDSNASRYNPSLKVYPVSIAISGQNEFLKPGMTAKVEIIVDELKGVTYIPVQAVFVENDEYFVYLKSGFSYKRHQISVGQNNDEFIEVTSGLKEGQSVALSKPEDYDKP